MIKYVNSQSPHLQVRMSGGGAYYNTSNPMAGMVRYYNNDFQVYDGSSWLNITGSADISLSSDAESVINWAKIKMTEEMRLKELMEKHPGLKDAYEKFEIMKILVTEEDRQK